MTEGINEAAGATDDLNAMLKENADASKGAEKSAKKFLAAFDEVYSIGDDDELDFPANKDNLPTDVNKANSENKDGATDKGKEDDDGLGFFPPGKRPPQNPPSSFMDELINTLQAAKDKALSIWNSLVVRYEQVLDLFSLPVFIPAPALAPRWKTVSDFIDDIKKKLAEPWPQPQPVPVPALSPLQMAIQAALEVVKGFWAEHKTAVLLTVGAIILGVVAYFLGLPALILEGLAILLPRLAMLFGRIPGLFSTALSRLPVIASSIAATVGNILSGIGNKIGNVVDKAKPLLSGAMGKAGNFINQGITGARNYISGLANGVTVPAFAAGAIATGPTFGLFGEAGDEAILPLSRINPIIDAAVDSSLQNRSGGTSADYIGFATAMASEIVAALQNANIIARIDTGRANMIALDRAQQQGRQMEKARVGGI